MNTQTQYPKPDFVLTPASLTIYFPTETRPKTIANGHPNYGLAVQAIRDESWGALYKLSDMVTAIARYSKGAFEVKGEDLFYNNELVEGALARKVIHFMKEKLPFDGLLKFYDNLEQNPSMVSRRELYDFLNAQDPELPITEDGHFLAYKAVRNDWTDKHSGTISNAIGTTVTMPRPKVDDDRGRGCSQGLHAGSWAYVQWFGNDGDRKIMVKINPRDVVSVPSEDHRKLRCCEYTVVRTFEDKLLDPMYAADGSDWVNLPKGKTFEVLEDDPLMDVFDDERYDSFPNEGNSDINDPCWDEMDDDWRDDEDYNDGW